MVVLLNNTQTLAVCDQGCLTCSAANPGSCGRCLPGYLLVPYSNNALGFCKPCAAGCNTCTNTTTVCLTCYPGWLLQNGTCTACSSSCLTCQLSPSICTSCPSYMTLTS